MSDTTLTKTFDNLVTSTLEHRRSEFTKQAFLVVPLLNWLKDKGRVEEVPGGAWLEVPVLYGRNNTLKWLGTGGVVSITDSNVLTMAIAYWRRVALSIVRFGEDDRKNNAKYKAISYVNAKLEAANQTVVEELENVFFVGDDTGDKPYGLGTLIPTDPTTGTVMGIDRSVVGNEYWRNQAVTTVTAATLPNVMATMKRLVMQYAGSVWSDYALFTSSLVYGYYETQAYGKVQIYDTKVADLGFGGLKFDGVPIMWSPSAPTTSMYFLNSKHLKLYIDPGNWLTLTDWKLIPDQPDDRVAQMKAVMQLCIHKACNHGVIYGITAS